MRLGSFLPAGLAAGFFILAPSSLTPLAAQPPGLPPAPATTALVEEGSIAQSIRLTGNVEPLFMTTLRSEQAGFIERLQVDVGDYVTTGQVVLQLRRLPFEVAVARAQAAMARAKAELDELEAGTRAEDITISRAVVEERQASLEVARLEFERYESLFKEGSVSASEFDERRTRYIVARAEASSARAQLERDEAGERPEVIMAVRADYDSAVAALRLAEDQLERAVVRAPFAGTITERHAGPGGWLSIGDDILTLEYIDQVKIQLSVSESYFSSVRVGSEFDLNLEAFPQTTFRGRVYQRVYRADLRSRSFPVNLIVDNPDRRIAPGMLARARLVSDFDGQKSMLVPRDALVASQWGAYVVRANLDDTGTATAEMIDVQTGRFFGELVEVFGDLLPNQQIVIRGNERIQPGQELILNQFITDPQSSRVLNPAGFFNERR